MFILVKVLDTDVLDIMNISLNIIDGNLWSTKQYYVMISLIITFEFHVKEDAKIDSM
jgi:hypothetical protein